MAATLAATAGRCQARALIARKRAGETNIHRVISQRIPNIIALTGELLI
jgi:hypothetical protein